MQTGPFEDTSIIEYDGSSVDSPVGDVASEDLALERYV